MDSGQAQARKQIHASSFASLPHHFTQELPSHTTPILTMNDNEVPVTSESLEHHPASMWTTPIAPGLKPRPATIHEGFQMPIGEDFGALTPWDSSALPFQQMHGDVLSRPGSVHSFHQPQGPYHNVLDNSWMHKPCDDGFELNGLEQDMSIGQAFTTDEAIPITDLRYGHRQQDGEHYNMEEPPRARRMSGSSFTMSTSGAPSDMPSYDDFSAAMSDAPSFSTDYPPTSNRNSLMSSTQLSPVASPRMTPQSRTELVRSQSRGRASPSPRPGVRSAPYTFDGGRTKRWSTGSYGTTPARRQSPFIYQATQDVFGAQHMQRTSSPGMHQLEQHHQQAPLNYTNLQTVQQPHFMVPNVPHFARAPNFFMPSQMPPQGFNPHAQPPNLDNPPTLMSHGLFRMLSSNTEPHPMHSHYADHCDPPDLYASLHEQQIPPPPEDMNPSDPDMVPHEQELRFEGDLYTPRWVRGHGNKREGWCGICKPGRWLVLKNSAYWYDKSFTHGVSAATGSPFHEPMQTRRMDGNPDVWEGLCTSCNDWIALVSSKKKGTTWFRHAYKCHTHPKIKDGPKRRREASNPRILAASQMAKPGTVNQEPAQAPLTPQMTPASMSLNTPTPGQLQPHGHFQQSMSRPPSSHIHQEHMRNMMSSPLGPMPNMI
ncbi:hypothetical protein F5X68DRAFT_9403 [Plectosphaerella plurivora]|uniref:Transcription regulator Rua1 C-terminal domain-containing protein n=1 Tax=Plectosphaerella plurivora TaxID=936078 RepID=A0A9P8VD96_9PEZI|nr:hypothetical protein F5X68DRAFT_9403 [Plectosphaerella plurivora]